MTNNEIWQAVLSELELAISKANFNTWFKNTGIVTFTEGHVILCVPNTFNQAWIEKKHHHQIIQSLERITALPIKRLEYKIENIKNVIEQVINTTPTPVTNHEMEKPPSYAQQISSQPVQSGGFTINPKYSFDSFVVGKGSELAFTAAKAVADRPGEAYNPLFIYGGVGLGKTHLLQAVGNELLRKNPSTRILYVTCERFTNDYINAVRSGQAREFKNRYRTVDVLLVDDIQFITGKEGTQEEFFHTFNQLYQNNKQIIISSDRPPKAIPTLEKRLISRFECGMMADVGSPDFETRVAILESKCRDKCYPLEREILHHVATTVQVNVRELEGALNKIIAFHQFKNMSPSVDTIKPILSSFSPQNTKKNVTPRHLIHTVAQYFEIKTDDLLGKSREKRLAFPRQIVMYLMREEMKASYPSIGTELGGRDHTTAMHAYD